MCSSWKEVGGVWFLSRFAAPKTHILAGGRFLVVSVFCMNGTVRSTMSVATLANACITTDPNCIQDHKICRFEGYQFDLIKVTKGLF